MFLKTLKNVFSRPQRSRSPARRTFILEPIWTPSAIIDVGEEDVEFDLSGDFDFWEDSDLPSSAASALEVEAAIGVFSAPETGVIEIAVQSDNFAGEVGLFSLAGMEDLDPDSDAFITEALQRAQVLFAEDNPSPGSAALNTAQTLTLDAEEPFAFVVVREGTIADAIAAEDLGIDPAQISFMTPAEPDEDLRWEQGEQELVLGLEGLESDLEDIDLLEGDAGEAADAEPDGVEPELDAGADSQEPQQEAEQQQPGVASEGEPVAGESWVAADITETLPYITDLDLGDGDEAAAMGRQPQRSPLPSPPEPTDAPTVATSQVTLKVSEPEPLEAVPPLESPTLSAHTAPESTADLNATVTGIGSAEALSPRGAIASDPIEQDTRINSVGPTASSNGSALPEVLGGWGIAHDAYQSTRVGAAAAAPSSTSRSLDPKTDRTQKPSPQIFIEVSTFTKQQVEGIGQNFVERFKILFYSQLD
ncbi:MAG: hypothetical protein ACPGVO_20705 [Spirulinaceae cyanobacterium]